MASPSFLVVHRCRKINRCHKTQWINLETAIITRCQRILGFVAVVLVGRATRISTTARSDDNATETFRGSSNGAKRATANGGTVDALAPGHGCVCGKSDAFGSRAVAAV